MYIQAHRVAKTSTKRPSLIFPVNDKRSAVTHVYLRRHLPDTEARVYVSSTDKVGLNDIIG